MLLSIVIPCYNEQEVLEQTIAVLTDDMKKFGYDYELVFVDDGSKDKTLEILQKHASENDRIKVVSFAANRGQQMAFYAGMCYSSGDAVVLMDADLQDPPELIPEMVKLWKEGYQVVYGKRKSREGETPLKKLTASLYYRFLDFMSDVSIPQNVGEFRLMDRVVVDAVVQVEESNRFNRALVSWLGFKQTELEFERPERFAGETKFGYKEMINLAKDGIFSFSYMPITVIQIFGLVSIFISVIVFLYVLASYIFGWVAPGWSSIMVLISFFSGAIMFSLGVLGEYIARIHTEVIKRPLFVSAQTFNLKDKTLPEHVSRYMSSYNNNLK